MAKSKTAFFGLGTTGSIGNALSFARRRGITIAEKKPVPIDRQSLSQMYQRWLYEDYVYLWHQQTPAQKAEYATLGGKSQLTAYQYFMSYQLTFLPDIILMSRLDLDAEDYSRNQNDGTIFGASTTDGIIGRALHFDGLNDYVKYPHIPAYLTPTAFTLEIRFRPHPTPANGALITNYDAVPNYGWLTYCYIAPPKLRFSLYVAGVGWKTNTEIYPYVSGKWHTFHATYDGLASRIYCDAQLLKTLPAVGAINQIGDNGIALGRWSTANPGDWWKGDLDHCILYNRVLDQTEITCHAERSYYL